MIHFELRNIINVILHCETLISWISAIMGNSERVLQDRYVHVRNDEKALAISRYTDKITC